LTEFDWKAFKPRAIAPKIAAKTMATITEVPRFILNRGMCLNRTALTPYCNTKSCERGEDVYCVATVADVFFVVPPAVVHVRSYSVAVVIAEVCATPLVLRLFAFAAVKIVSVGLETTHDCIPAVTQPIEEVCPAETIVGFAMRTIDGWLTCTEHCWVAVCVPLVQVKPYVTVFVPVGGTATIVEAEPESWVPVEKPDPLDPVALEQE